jgi:hypothetical protein
MELSMAPPRERVNEGLGQVFPPGESPERGARVQASLRPCETVGYINWLEFASIRL